MNRRGFLGVMGGALAAPCVVQANVPQGPRYGAMTVERHTQLCQQGLHLHTMHNGEDVSRDCHFADDTGDGMAELFVRNQFGRHYVDPQTGSVAMRIVRGVTMVPGAPFQ
jgi:hypothetical protein